VTRNEWRRDEWRRDETKWKQEIEQQLKQGADSEVSLEKVKLALADFRRVFRKASQDKRQRLVHELIDSPSSIRINTGTGTLFQSHQLP
jgi:hypothetical protein